VAPRGDPVADRGSSPGSEDASDDLTLLRRFEPIVRYTAGELFYPMATDGYVRDCDLFVTTEDGKTIQLASPGELTLESLATWTIPAGQIPFLRLVQKPLNGVELAQWQRRPDRVPFHAPGRLARVGLFARLIDAGFNASLVVRGTVPGGTTAAASIKYQALRREDPRYVYHGRVVRQDGWIVLHYLYFYAMNDWRSTFAGANDHEADLEQAFVVLEDGDNDVRPVWFGCAAHDYSGDELRRRWDDPTLVTVGDHPVIHAGAGSHAAYFEAGEYVTTVPLPALRGLHGLLDGLRDFWRDTLRQTDPGDLANRVERALSIPFVDYARGDGLAIGPDQAASWSPIVVTDGTPWVEGYRGLWGLDTRDRFGGERAPAGLKYSRDGSVRQAWGDPLGFLGLDKMPPPGRMPAVLETRIDELEQERASVTDRAETDAAVLRRLAAERWGALDGGLPLGEVDALSARVDAGERGLAAMRRRVAEIDGEVDVLRAAIRRAEAGDLGPPQAHLKHPHRPEPPSDRAFGRFVEAWSAISVSLMLVALVALLYTAVVPWWGALLIAVGGYVLIEAAFRRRLTQLLLAITIGLAVVGAILLALVYATELVILAIVAVAVLTLLDNLRELRG
jgi:hypothetical protein